MSGEVMAGGDSPTPGAVCRHAEVRERLPVFTRNGEVVFSRGTRFPPHCVKCGAQAAVTRRVTLYWQPGSFSVSLVIDLPTENAVVDLPLCLHHAARRRQMIQGGWSGVAVSLALLLGALWSLGPESRTTPWVLTALGAVTALASGIALSRSDDLLQAVEINDFGVRARGAGQAFLDKLPTGNW
jgi:hypothetical protein